MSRTILNVFKASALVAAASAALGASASARTSPGTGHPGCYARIAYPPAYRTVTGRVTGPPVVRYRDVPPVVEHYQRRILVRPARTERETIAPVYRTVWRWIEVPGPARRLVSPPVYRTVTQRRLISPAHLVWRPGGTAHGFAPGELQARGEYGSGGGLPVRPTGEVLCRVLAPARYAWTRRRVMVSPARETTIQAPPHHMRVRDRVLVQPGRTVQHLIPAVYRTVDCTRIVRPAGRQRIVRPGPARLVSRRIPMGPAHEGWAPIVCAPRPGSRPVQSYGGGQSYGGQPYGGESYGAPSYGGPAYGAPSAPVQTYGGGGSNQVMAPVPSYPATRAPSLVPAPYDVGRPARP
jgi:hypothetical protein